MNLQASTLENVLQGVDPQQLLADIQKHMMSRMYWDRIRELTSSTAFPQEILPEIQRSQWVLPKGGIELRDGRTLIPIIGYNAADIARGVMRDEGTAKSIKLSRAWRSKDGLVVSLAVNSADLGDLVHIAMSYPYKDPSWEEIKELRALFFPPFIDCMMMLPKTADYVNVHPHCFHLWQCPSSWGIS